MNQFAASSLSTNNPSLSLIDVTGDSSIRHDQCKQVIEARLVFIRTLSPQSQVTIEDSGVDAFIENFDRDPSGIYPMIMNCIRYHEEVQGKPYPVKIDRELVELTVADIRQSLAPVKWGKPGKLKGYLI